MHEKESILNTIGDFPPFPQIAIKATEVLNDPDASARDLVRIIQYDPQITANVLRFANSAYFGIPNRVNSLHQAVTLLGSQLIMDLLFLSSAITYFKQDFEIYGLKAKDMLIHSVTTALLSRHLTEKMALKDTSAAFTAGLLHDIGKQVINAFLHNRHDEIARLLQDPAYSFVQAEQQILGVNHAQVGKEMASKWGLPEEITVPISGHHPQDEDRFEAPLTAVVYLADQVYFLLNKTPGADRLSFDKIKQALDRCELTEKDLDASVLQMHREWGEVHALIFT